MVSETIDQFQYGLSLQQNKICQVSSWKLVKYWEIILKFSGGPEKDLSEKSRNLNVLIIIQLTQKIH